MKTVLLPVKDFRNAKQRLATSLDADTRVHLARAMLSDVFHAVSQATVPDRVVVFTASRDVSDMARAFGFDVVGETAVAGHSAAVNFMVQTLSATASQIFSIAGDLPRLRAAEIDFVMNTVHEPIAILPSRDGTGTNGIVFLPPARIELEYGEGSFRRHISRVAAAGHRAQVLNVPGIAFDVDTPEDLQAFLDDPRKDGHTWRYLTTRSTDSDHRQTKFDSPSCSGGPA